MMKKYLASLFLLFSVAADARVVTGDVSKPMQFDKVGWNKVLMLHSGNTVLVHVEAAKMDLKIFDTAHKEVVHREYSAKDFDHKWMRSFSFKGLLELNGEIVLFSGNVFGNKKSLLRIVFDAGSGAVKDEQVMLADGYGGEENSYYLLPEHSGGFSVLSFRDIIKHPQASITLYRYNDHDSLTSTIPIHLAYRAAYKMMVLAAGVSDADDIYFVSAVTGVIGKGTEFRQNHHQVAFSILEHGTTSVRSKTIDLPDVPFQPAPVRDPVTGDMDAPPAHEQFPFATGYDYDVRGRKLNVILVDPTIVFSSNPTTGNSMRRSCVYNLYSVYAADMTIDSTSVKFDAANAHIKEKQGPAAGYQAIPTVLLSRSGGLTLLSENYGDVRVNEMMVSHFDEHNVQRSVSFIAWQKFTGTYSRPEDLYYANNPIYDMPMSQYDGIRCYSTDSLIYIFCNENNIISDPANPGRIPRYEPANAYCYIVNNYGEAEKSLPFGTPAKDEKLAMLMESAHLDPVRHTFACLIQSRRGDLTDYHVAWCYVTNFIVK